MDLKSYIREFRNFPISGVNFKDISPILKSPQAMHYIMTEFEQHFADKDIDLVAGTESRGLIFASAFAAHIGKGCFMIRKAGKLPGSTIQMAYGLEYGEGTLEIQADAVQKGQNVLILDDLLATGGTAHGSAKLIEKAGGNVAGFGFAIELNFFNGRELLADYDIKTLVNYDE